MDNTLVNPQILSALAKHIAPSNDVRFYMNGVLVDVSISGTHYVATDGHMLLVAHEAHSLDYKSEAIIIPRDVCLKVKPKGKHPWPTAELQAISDTESALMYQGDRFAFNHIDGKFPDYRRILPTKIEVDGKAGHFNPDYLMAMQKFSQDMGSKSIIALYPNGPNSPACVSFADSRFFGVIMPLRQDAPHYPDWLRSSLAIAA